MYASKYSSLSLFYSHTNSAQQKQPQLIRWRFSHKAGCGDKALFIARLRLRFMVSPLACASHSASSPGGFTRKRNRVICSFFFFNKLAIGGFYGENPAEFQRLRTLQRHKIDRNPMQYPTPQKYNPKRREKIVTKFSLLRKRLRILRLTYIVVILSLKKLHTMSIFCCDLLLNLYL